MVIHADKVRWLAWLRLKMFLRNFQRNPRILILTIIGLLFMLFLGGELALGLLFAFNTLSTAASIEVLYLLFTSLMLFWIALPLLSYSTNEGLDVTKLQLFPLTRLELMCSLLFSSLFDIWTVLLFILFGVTIVAWWLHSLALGLMTFLVIVVFYIVMVGLSQLTLALLMRTLQSRKFRDISVIILALFGSSCYLISRFSFGADAILNLGSALDQHIFSLYLQWLPSGVAASSIRAAIQGNWLISFALLGLLLVICAIALYLWQLVLERSMTASETGAAKRSKQQLVASTPALALQVPTAISRAHTTPERVSSSQAMASSNPARPFNAKLSEQLQALVKKEVICIWRDPQLKVRMVQTLVYVVIFVLLPLFSASNGTHLGRDSFDANYAPFSSVGVVFLFMLMFSLNTLGMERRSLTALVLFPIDRRRLLWGKNLAVWLMGVILLVLLMFVCAVTSQQQAMILPATIIGLAGMGVTLGSGNLSSVYFPSYQRAIGQRGYAATGGQAQSSGCLNQLMSVVMLITTVILLTPVALSIGIPFFLNMQFLWLVTMPLSLAYGLGLYILFTNLAAKRMLAKEPEILAITTRE